jgi:hypothetical protein
VSDSETDIPLNENQRRHFEVVLASLEDALVRTEQMSGPTGIDDRLLTHIAHDVPPEFGSASAPAIAAIRAEIARLAQTMHLEGRRPSTRRMMRAILVSQIVHLEDSDARRLRAYGSVDPRLASTLDPALGALIDILRGLLYDLEHPARAPIAPGNT